MRKCTPILVVLFSIVHKISCTDSSYDVKILKDLLADYDWKLRPFGNEVGKRKGGPLLIHVNLLLRTISKIDDVNMEFSTQFTFRQTWIDPRLAYGQLLAHEPSAFEVDTASGLGEDKKIPDFVILVPGDRDLSEYIWTPDTFFQNEKSAQKHMIDKPNVLIRIYPDGKVLYSVRLSLVLSCIMSLIEYPMDSQECYIDFSSYAYAIEDILYFWSNDTNAVQLKDTVEKSLPSFELIGVSTTNCVSNTSTGEYSCLRVRLKFKRMFSYYLLQLYIPSFMLVIVSWVSFWVDKSSVPARVTLGVTTLLTITTQASGINAKLPPVSYTKAIDIWIGVCLAFVFGALLEYALVNYADEGHAGRYSFTPRRKRGTYTDHTSEISSYHCCNQTDPHQRRFTLLPNGNLHNPLSPLLGRYSNCSYRWSEEEDVGRKISLFMPSDQMHQCFSTESGASQLPISYMEPSCSNCFVAINPTVHSFADRRLANLSSARCAPSRNRVYKRLGRWASTLYHEADRAKKIDVISRVMFPFLFFCFNAVYWTLY